MKTLLAACLLVPVLMACTEKQDVPPPAVVAVVATLPTIEEGVIAVVRGHPHSTKVCHEPAFAGYFIHYKEKVDGAPEDDHFHGWYIVQNMKFYKSSNNTWFIGDNEAKDYVVVYPDITGLTCKDQ